MQETTFGTFPVVFPAQRTRWVESFLKVCYWSLKELSISIALCWFCTFVIMDWYPWKVNSSRLGSAVSIYVNVGAQSQDLLNRYWGPPCWHPPILEGWKSPFFGPRELRWNFRISDIPFEAKNIYKLQIIPWALPSSWICRPIQLHHTKMEMDGSYLLC